MTTALLINVASLPYSPGNTFELFRLHTIGSGNLHAAAMPDAKNLQKNIESLAQCDISIVVSLLESTESNTLGLGKEAHYCVAQGIEFISYPITDFGVPDSSEFPAFINTLYQRLTAGENTLIHCRGGVGRTGTTCCCLLIQNGMSATQAIERVTAQRKVTVPETEQQTELVHNFIPAG